MVDDLHRTFGGVSAVSGATFSIPASQITGLIGPNGAGKSTVVNLVSGLLKPTSGRILFAGCDIAGWSMHRVARLGLIRTFQLSSEFPRLTVMENLLVAAGGKRGDTVAEALRGRRHWRRNQAELLERARELLAGFGLAAAEDKYAGELSGGQKRLLEIARGLMHDPKLLLLDEPFAGVNPALAAAVENHLTKLRDEGLTMILIEHELGAVERLCDSVIVMAQGAVLARGSMHELRSNKEVLSAYLTG